jgi:hypothetical protein
MGKSPLTEQCLHSLVTALNLALKSKRVSEVDLTVVDDHSDSLDVERLEEVLTRADFPSRLTPLVASGNGNSLRWCYEAARVEAPELIYFVEDDYLHAPEAIGEMVGMFVHAKSQQGQEVVIFPCDYVARYTNPCVSKVFLGEARFWRSIDSTTGTFMITRNILEKYWPIYKRFTDYGCDPLVTEQSTIDFIYKETLCLAPMPSLALHMHEGLISPYINWRSWWQTVSAGVGSLAATGTPVGLGI